MAFLCSGHVCPPSSLSSSPPLLLPPHPSPWAAWRLAALLPWKSRVPLFLSDWHVAIHMPHEVDQNAFSSLSSRDHGENLIEFSMFTSICWVYNLSLEVCLYIHNIEFPKTFIRLVSTPPFTLIALGDQVRLSSITSIPGR